MSPLRLVAPLPGWALPLDEVPDAAFAGRMLGDGLAIDPTDGTLHAPCDGVLVSVAPTGHALTLRTDNGAELLLHVGIDTVGLKGRGFEPCARAGARVRAGDLLLRFDLDAIARLAPSLITPLVITNGPGFTIARRSVGQRVGRGDFLMELLAASGAASTPASSPGATLTRRVRVALPHGIHARPAAMIAHGVRDRRAEVRVSAHGRRANARSTVSLMALGVRGNDDVTLEATGEDAAAALETLAALLAPGSPEPPAAAAGTAPVSKLSGVVAAHGIALGMAAPLLRREREVARHGSDAAHETAELARARGAVRANLAARAGRSAGPRAEILSAHLELLDDPAILDAAATAIQRGESAGYAWRGAIRASIDALRDLGDARLAERADDLFDLESQVLDALAGEAHEMGRELPDQAIVLADQLLPSQLLALDAARLAGICTARGGATSHVAILAAAMGKPMLVNLGAELLAIQAGTRVLLDTDRRILQVDPPDADASAAAGQIRERRERDAEERAAAHGACTTADGVRIEVFANVGSAAEAAAAVALGAEGCGLLRTEFLFLDRRSAPDVDVQAAEYRRVIDAFGGRPVVIRTLDAGDDKAIPYLAFPVETNPALGLRGIRAGFRRPDLLRTQLKAILTAAAASRSSLMLPMVQEPAEIVAVREWLDELAGPTGQSNRPALGAMIETPSAAVIADRICEVADFVSIGTNDLTQYTLAMDRTHPDLAGQLDGLHPAVLRLIRSTAAAAAARARPVAVCGSLAADPAAVPVLLGLGVQELSVVPGAIPHIKSLIRGLRLSSCRELADRALELPSAAAVRALVRETMGDSR